MSKRVYARLSLQYEDERDCADLQITKYVTVHIASEWQTSVGQGPARPPT
jgi:hypothetical protein